MSKIGTNIYILCQISNKGILKKEYKKAIVIYEDSVMFIVKYCDNINEEKIQLLAKNKRIKDDEIIKYDMILNNYRKLINFNITPPF
tara:strand:+ start:741 stop:1001 length:261 start_codon:yes stop_codon:yes gene_type:complete